MADCNDAPLRSAAFHLDYDFATTNFTSESYIDIIL